MDQKSWSNGRKNYVLYIAWKFDIIIHNNFVNAWNCFWPRMQPGAEQSPANNSDVNHTLP